MASTRSQARARCRAKPPVEVKQSSAFPRGIAGGGEVVFALIEKDAGFLAVQQVGLHAEAVHVDGDGFFEVAR